MLCRCLEDEDLDAIGVTDSNHRQLIKTRSQQQGEAETPVEDAGGDLDFANVLSDLDSIIGELGAFGNVSFYPHQIVLFLLITEIVKCIQW